MGGNLDLSLQMRESKPRGVTDLPKTALTPQALLAVGLCPPHLGSSPVPLPGRLIVDGGLENHQPILHSLQPPESPIKM